MKVALVCPRHVPPVRGGAERVWDGIVREINARTAHTADLVAVDTPEGTFEEVVRSYARFDALDVSGYDRVISSKYPAWMVRHPNHVVYMQHPLRGLYDTYRGPLAVPPTGLSREAVALVDALRSFTPGVPGGRSVVIEQALLLVDTLPTDHPDLAFPGPLIRLLVRWLDRDALSPGNTVAQLAISRTVAAREGYFPDAGLVDVVIHPSGLDGLGPGVGRHVFTASRLDRPKRLDLLIDAMAFVQEDVELRIAGTGPEESSLRDRAAKDPRIRFLGFVDDEQLADEYASAIVVPFVPMDEDLGLITLEAQMCYKPVVTCTDSGGATELVHDGVEGFVVSPTPRDVGTALQRLVSDRALAEEMGSLGFERARKVSWDKLLDALLEDREVAHAKRGTYRRSWFSARTQRSLHATEDRSG